MFKVKWKRQYPSDCDADSSRIVTEVLKGNTFATNMFILCQDNVQRTSIDLIKKKLFQIKKTRNKWYPAETMRDAENAHYAEDPSVLANTPAQAEPLQHYLGQATKDL